MSSGRYMIELLEIGEWGEIIETIECVHNVLWHDTGRIAGAMRIHSRWKAGHTCIQIWEMERAEKDVTQHSVSVTQHFPTLPPIIYLAPKDDIPDRTEEMERMLAMLRGYTTL